MDAGELYRRYVEALNNTSLRAQQEFLQRSMAIDWRGRSKPRSELKRLMEGVVGKYGAVAALVAADYYERERETATGEKYRAVLADAMNREQVDKAADYAARHFEGVEEEEFVPADEIDATVKSAQARVDKYVTAPARSTLRENMDRDPRRTRWARIPGDNACDFCKMLGSRGFVYHTAETAGAKGHGTGADTYHPYCRCEIAVAHDVYFTTGAAAFAVRGHSSDAPGDYGENELYAWYLGEREKGKFWSTPASRVINPWGHFKEEFPGVEGYTWRMYLQEATTLADLQARWQYTVDWFADTHGHKSKTWRYTVPVLQMSYERRMRELASRVA